MNHLTESELTLHYYGDASDPILVERHLAECEACRRQFHEIQTVLTAVAMEPPERESDYEARLWSCIAPRLEPISTPQKIAARVFPSRRWIAWPRWAAVGAVAALLTAVFFLGRLSERAVPGNGSVSPGVSLTSANAAIIRRRVLLVAVGNHLDRTHLLLTELANADPAKSMDISSEEKAARELLDDGRLYRQTAAQIHDEALVQMLDELERLLVDLSHRSPTVSLAEWQEIQHHIQSQGILFKIRVVGSEIREQEREMRNSTAGKIET